MCLLTYLLYQCFLIKRENFDNKKEINSSLDKDIEDPISNAYIPTSTKIINDDNYEIIKLYKEILNRDPSREELQKAKFIDIKTLKIQLLNTPEYNHMISMQTNDVESGIEGAIAKKDLLNKIAHIYKHELDRDIKRKLLLPLRDCYIHLQFNEYLFRAMLINNNYDNFENDVLNTKMLNKKKLLELFNKYFDLNELKLKANDIIKTFKLSDLNPFQNSNNKEYKQTIENKICNAPISDNYSHNNNMQSQINTILNNSEKIFNKDHIAKKELDNNKDPKSEIILRVYEPIQYNNSYKGPKEYRPPVCNNLGLNKTNFNPVIMNNDGVDYKSAFDMTQVGSIMPNFEYKEYKDIVIKKNNV